MPAELSGILKTIFLFMLTLVGGGVGIAVLAGLLEILFDKSAARQTIHRALGIIVIAICSAAFLVGVVKLLVPKAKPTYYYDQLLDENTYMLPSEKPSKKK